MKTSVTDLVDAVLSELDRLQYAKKTISQYRTVYKKYALFTQNRGPLNIQLGLGIDGFSRDAGLILLRLIRKSQTNNPS
jgi:hypothetical protein